MTFRASPSTVRSWRAIRFALLLTACLLIAHDAVYVVRYGVGVGFADAMATGGRHLYWPLFAWLAFGAAILLAASALIQLAMLWPRARLAAPHLAPRGSNAAEAGRLWLALFPALAVGYAGLENAEHFVADGHLVGLAPLLDLEHAVALPVLAAISAVAAALGGLVRWRIAVLEARIAAHVEHPRRRRAASEAAGARWRLIAALAATARLRGRPEAGRAPPSLRPT